MNGKIGVLRRGQLRDRLRRPQRASSRSSSRRSPCRSPPRPPKYVAPADVPADILDKEKEIIRDQLKDSKKPPEIVEKIVEGKLSKFYEEVCLLEQPYIRDDKVKVKDLITQFIAKFKENIKVGRFVRFEIAEIKNDESRTMAVADSPAYNRILLKLSGESLLGELAYGIDFDRGQRRRPRDQGGPRPRRRRSRVMIGGGNIFRGVRGHGRGHRPGLGRPDGHAGHGHQRHRPPGRPGEGRRPTPATSRPSRSRPWPSRSSAGGSSATWRRAGSSSSRAGIGSPYFTTDTAAALRALEIGAEVILKATKVDGVYTADPMTDKTAKRFKSIRYIDVLKKGLKVMDATAISLCKDNNLPIIVFSLGKGGNIKRAVLGEDVGTRVY